MAARKRLTLDSLATSIRHALFVDRDPSKALDLVRQAQVLVQDVRTKHQRELWTDSLDGWTKEAELLQNAR